MLIWAETVISCAHHMGRNTTMHGHSYKVRVYAKEGIDVQDLQDKVRQVACGLDHTCLNDILSEPSMEEIARFFADRIWGCVRVLVERPLEGVGCEHIP